MVGSGKRDQKSRAVAEDPVSDSTPHIEQLIEQVGLGIQHLWSPWTLVSYTRAGVCVCTHTNR